MIDRRLELERGLERIRGLDLLSKAECERLRGLISESSESEIEHALDAMGELEAQYELRRESELELELELELGQLVMAIFQEAINLGKENSHEYVTIEHLFLVLLDDPSTLKVLRRCGANVRLLRKELTDFILATTPLMKKGSGKTIQPTLGFQRVIHRTISIARDANKEANGTHMLMSLFDEKNSQAYQYLEKHKVSKDQVIESIQRIESDNI